MPWLSTRNDEGGLAALLEEKGRLLEALLRDVGDADAAFPHVHPRMAAAFAERSRRRVERLRALDRSIEAMDLESTAGGPPSSIAALWERIGRLVAQLHEANARLRAAAEAVRCRVEEKGTTLEAGKRCLRALRPWKDPKSRRYDASL